MPSKLNSLLFSLLLVSLLTASRNAQADTLTFSATGGTAANDIDARGSFTFDPDPALGNPNYATSNYLEYGGVTDHGGCVSSSYDGLAIGTLCDDEVYTGPGNGFTLVVFPYEGNPFDAYFVATLASNPYHLYLDFDVNITYTYGDGPTITPEPSTFALLGTGLLGIAGVVKRRLV